MENIVRNVKDIDTADRRALEHVIGQHLAENQQLVIHVVNVDVVRTRPVTSPSTVALPEWCNVYEGLSDQEVSALEKVVLMRADLSRDSE
ncbi:MAG: hypothetical protein NTY19_30065 [Planctomycetota bacterium]|nr:hypothetical protein [Planctomycetota bacterium]